MHHALSLPEVVSNILQTQEAASSLHACLVVNKLFFNEASRIIWEKCGIDQLSPLSHPPVQHLASLALHSPGAAQHYADMIRELCINVQLDWALSTFLTSNIPSPNEEWHKSIIGLKFPRLEVVSFDGMLVDDEEQSDSATKGIYIHAFRTLVKDGLVDWLKDNSPNLKSFYLTLGGNTSDNLSESEFLEFIRSTPTLKHLGIQRIPVLNALLTRNTFRVLAESTSFQSLELPVLTEDLFSNINASSPRNLFPKLETIIAHGTENALELLVNCAKHLVALEFGFRGASERSLQIISCLPHLRTLHARFDAIECPFSGSDLVLLSKSCPNLQLLQLTPEFFPSTPNGPPRPILPDEIIDDTAIEQFAKNLPKLVSFSLCLFKNSLCTSKSLAALGNYCKRLDACVLSADISFSFLLQLCEAKTFTSLKYLELVTDYGNHYDQTIDMSLLAQKFLELMPKLRSFVIIGESAKDVVFREAVTRILTTRPKATW